MPWCWQRQAKRDAIAHRTESGTRAQQHQRPLCNHKDLANFPKYYGHLREKGGLGQRAERVLEKDDFKLEKRLLKQEETQIFVN